MGWHSVAGLVGAMRIPSLFTRLVPLLAFVLALNGLAFLDARAQTFGLNLSWDDCGTAGAMNKDFACAADTGVSVLVASVALSGGLSPVAVQSFIVFLFDGAVPSWWALQSGGCRTGQFAVDTGTGISGCMDYWGTHQGSSVAAWSLHDSGSGPDGYKINMITGTQPEFAERLDSPTEISAGRILIYHQKTAGADSCEGCSVKGGFTYLAASLNVLEFGQDLGSTNPYQRQFVLWQNGIVPNRRTTWGGIKALYR